MDVMHSGFSRWLRRGCGIVIVLLFWDVAVLSAAKCQTDVTVASNHESLLLVVNNDTVDHVLETLDKKTNSRYHSAKPLNKIVNGTFSGPLWQVLSRILDGFNYALVNKPAGAEIFVYGPSNSHAVEAPLVTPTLVRNGTTEPGANMTPLGFRRPSAKSYLRSAGYGDPRGAPVLPIGDASR